MIEVYTDGSCWPNPSSNGGWSFVAYEHGQEIHAGSGKAPGLTSNNRMELAGMLNALQWLGDRPARIFSDSRYVVDGLNSWCHGWARRGWMRRDKDTGQWQPVMNADLWRLLVAAKLPQHAVAWCKGHAGILGNERADQLAEAARMGVAA